MRVQTASIAASMPDRRFDRTDSSSQRRMSAQFMWTTSSANHECGEQDQYLHCTQEDLATILPFRADLTLIRTGLHSLEQDVAMSAIDINGGQVPEEKVPFYKTVKRVRRYSGRRTFLTLPRQSFRDVHIEGGVQTDQFCEAADAVIQFFGASGIFLLRLKPQAHVWNDVRSLQQCGFLGSAERPQ
jgi:hypothetical protein